MINLWDCCRQVQAYTFFRRLHKAVNMNEQRWQWLHRFFCLRKPDSYTVAIYKFRGKRRWRRGEGGQGGRGWGKGEEKIRALQQRLGSTRWRGMEIIGNSLEKRSIYGHKRVFVRINLMFTCQIT